MDGRTHLHNVPLLDPLADTGKSLSQGVSTSSPTAELSPMDEKSVRQVTDQYIPAIRGPNAQTISLALEEPNHAGAQTPHNDLTSEAGRAGTLYPSGSTEQNPIDGVEVPTRTLKLDRMELPISFTPPKTASKDTHTQSHVHPFRRLTKMLWKLLGIPIRIIMSIVKFLVMPLCLIVSIVWAIPCIILFITWSSAVFITAGDRCDDGDDDDDAFDTFRCWGVIPCCGTGFFFALALIGFKVIWSLGTVLVNPDNTSGLNHWVATSIYDMLDSF